MSTTPQNYLLNYSGLISDEFETSEAMCCDKRHQVAEKNIPDLGISFYVLYINTTTFVYP
jgi:hypothetical protein